MSIKKIDIKYLFAQNFLCFGPDGIEIDLTTQDKIILIKGDNLDNKSLTTSEDAACSNGTGKSSLQEVLVWGLYGKTIKGCLTGSNKISLDGVINNQIELTKTGKRSKTKKATVEVRFSNYKVIRTRSIGKSSLKFLYSASGNWDDDEDLSKGEMSATQKDIEEVLGLNYDSFVNLVVFTDNNSGSFLEAKTETKRNIIEDVLYLHVYNNYAKQANELYNEVKRNRKISASEYDLLLKEVEACIRRKSQIETQESDWHKAKKTEISSLFDSIALKKLELQNTDFGGALKKYDDSQVELAELNNKLISTEEFFTKFNKDMELAYKRQSDVRELKENNSSGIRILQSDIQGKMKEVEINKNLISSLKSKEDTVCDKCFSTVKKENFIDVIDTSQATVDILTKEILELKDVYEKEVELLNFHTTEFKKIEELIKKGEAKVAETKQQLTSMRTKISALSKMQKPETGIVEKLLEEQISNLEKQLDSKVKESEGESPYVQNIKNSIAELEEKEKETNVKLALIESMIEDEKYYGWWCGGFGDQGIRKLIINDIVPALNKKTAYWLQFLIDGKIKISFNDALEETIERNPPDGDPFIYHAMSGGERRRLNLAVSQAFAHIMMLSCGYTPSVVFLDEVTTNIDPSGVVGVYNMILELSKEKQVFVTTHDHDLLELLNGHGKVHLQKQKGITTLVK